MTPLTTRPGGALPWMLLGARCLAVLLVLLFLLPLGEKTLRRSALHMAATGLLNPEWAEASWDRSWVNGRPVAELVAERLPVTLQLVGQSVAIALGPALLLVWSVRRVRRPWLAQALCLPGLTLAFLPVPTLGLALLGPWMRPGQVLPSGLWPGSYILACALFGTFTAALQSPGHEGETPGPEWHFQVPPTGLVPVSETARGLVRSISGIGWYLPFLACVTLLVERLVALEGVGHLLAVAIQHTDLPLLWGLIRGLLTGLLLLRLATDLLLQGLVRLQAKAVG